MRLRIWNCDRLTGDGGLLHTACVVHCVDLLYADTIDRATIAVILLVPSIARQSGGYHNNSRVFDWQGYWVGT